MSYAPNVQVVFGPTYDSFLIIHGRHIAGQNMPQDLMDMFLKRAELAPFLRVAWIRLHQDAVQWAVKDSVTGYSYDEEWFKNPVVPEPDSLPARTAYCAFDVDGKGAFVRLNDGTWQIVTDPEESAVATSQKEQIARLREQLPNFDGRLQAIIYGKAARIYILTDGFHAELEDGVYGNDHPLCQTLRQHAEGWTLDESSSLSLYNHEYYVLKFKRVGATDFIPAFSNVVRMQSDVMAQLNELVEIWQTEDEQRGFSAEMDAFKRLTLGPAFDAPPSNAAWNAFQHMRANNASSHEQRLAGMYNNMGVNYKIGNTTYTGSGINY